MIATGKKLLSFYEELKCPQPLPYKIELMNPFKHEEVIKINQMFYSKYYNDNNSRILLLGINPGRFGAGVTGIPFTDPLRLETDLGIENRFEKKTELSSRFIYQMINQFGGPKKFFSRFILSAVCPLGFVKNRINLNYYDDKDLELYLENFILSTLREQIEIAGRNDICFCIGQGKNKDKLHSLNKKHHLFKRIIPLGHPRWIMQYRRKKIDYFINEYVRLLNSCTSTGTNS